MRIELTVAAVLLAVNLNAGVRSIWAASDGDKIDKDDISSPLANSNAVWDGRQIRLFAARNEIVAFQIIVEADVSGISDLKAQLPELVNGRSTIRYAPPGSDPTNYVSRHIQLFSLNYMLVKAPTQASWIYHPGSPSAPRNPTGWKPVQLVPENARIGRGGFPLSVSPKTNQAIWIEIYVGRDLQAGVYRGQARVVADKQTVSVPVELEVLDFTLPDENSMHAMLFFEPEQVPLYQGKSLDEQYHRFAHRHRAELVHAYDEKSLDVSFTRFTGTAFTRDRGYEGPGERVGNRIAPRTFYGPHELARKESAWPLADRWMRYLKGKLPRAITFIYLPDEPTRKDYDAVRKLAAMLRANPGPGSKLPLFITHEYSAELDDVPDIWCSGPQGFKIPVVAKERARGRRYWIYNGGRPAGGAIVIDAPATDIRALIWGSFKHEIEVYFYWHAVHWRHNWQKQGDRIQDVWANPVTFDNRGQPDKPAEDQNFANGDGVLIYPGEEKLHPDQDRGIPGPIATMQLANLRRGLQDHQYLTLARACGAEESVKAALAAVVPKMFSDAGETVGFAETAAEYEAARRSLARAIVACRSRGLRDAR